MTTYYTVGLVAKMSPYDNQIRCTPITIKYAWHTHLHEKSNHSNLKTSSHFPYCERPGLMVSFNGRHSYSLPLFESFLER